MLDAAALNTILRAGGLIAYPTEAVFGLGCDPLNQQAVLKLLQLKGRSVNQGLILIASNFQQLLPWISPAFQAYCEQQMLAETKPVTWLCPKAEQTPAWIHGSHSTVALRITQHPLAADICTAWGAPLVSTSANYSGEPALTTAKAVKECFGHHIDWVIDEPVGTLLQPTPLRNIITGEHLR